MKKVLLSLTLLAAAFAPAARAGIILSDDFNYNDGPICQPTASVINPLSTWFAVSGSGAGKDLDVTNNILIVTGSRSEDGGNVLAGQPYLTNGPVPALYARYTLKCTALPNSTGTYISHFTGTNVFGLSGFRCRVFPSMTNLVDGTGPDASLGQFNLGIANSGNGVSGTSAQNIIGSTNYVWPTPLLTNVLYTIVTRYYLSNGSSTLWVNPSAETDPSVTDPTPLPNDLIPPNTVPSNGVINISLYGFRQAFGEGTYQIDSLRIGTHFADVAGNNQSPAVSSIANQFIPANGNTGPLAFTVQDPETPASELTVTVTSDNTTLVPNGAPNIVTNSVGAGGTNRTVTITPVANQQGSANITITVSDTVNSSFTSFKVTVGTPSIATIPNQITTLNTATPPIPFAVGDTEGDAVVLSKSSSNPSLVTVGDIQLGVAVPNVSSNIVITPEAGKTGVSTITISATDGHTTNSTSFKITVTPAPLGVIYNEDFAYTNFVVPQALYGADGGSGAPWQHIVSSGSPSYQLQVTNFGTTGLAYLVGTNDEDVGAGFIGSAVYDGTNGYVFYTSFTVDFSFLPSNLGDYFFHLSISDTDTSAFHDKVFANRAGAATNHFRIGIANFAGAVIQQFPRDLSLGATYAVITRYNAATGDSTLWINPINAQSSSVTASDNPGSSIIGGVGLRQPGGSIGDLTVGPMKVGTSFSDVWTAPTPPLLSSAVDNSGNIILSWTNPLFVLQGASVVTGPYTDLSASSPYTNSISGQQFFRLKY